MLSKLYEVLKNEKFFLYSGKALTFFVLFFKDSDVSLSYVCFSFFTLLLIIPHPVHQQFSHVHHYYYRNETYLHP